MTTSKRGMTEAETGETPNRNVGFVSENHERLLPYEDSHWWFQKRNALITWMIKKQGPIQGRYLEIGCGNGCVTKAIADSFPDLEISATEYLMTGIENAKKRMPDAHIFQLDARDLDGSERYDVVGAFDVIEHIDDDVSVIGGIARALNPGGIFVINVPQHEWLWSVADEYACHQRRYSKKALHGTLEAAGLDVIYSTSYVSLLTPVMWLQRRRSKGTALEDYDAAAQFDIPAALNWALSAITSFEHSLRKLGVPFPIGGSRAVVARKR